MNGDDVLILVGEIVNNIGVGFHPPQNKWRGQGTKLLRNFLILVAFNRRGKVIPKKRRAPQHPWVAEIHNGPQLRQAIFHWRARQC